MARAGWSCVSPFQHVEDQSGLKLGISFPSVILGSDGTLAGQLLVKQFLLRAELAEKNRMPCHITTQFLFPSPCQKHKGELRTPKGKTQKCRGSPNDWIPLEFLSDLSTMMLQQFINCNSCFPSQGHWFMLKFLVVGFCSVKLTFLQLMLDICLSVCLSV